MGPGAQSKRPQMRLLVSLLMLCGGLLGLAAAAHPAAAVMTSQDYGFLSQIGGPGIAPAGFGGGSNPSPYGIATDAQGDVYVVEAGAGADYIIRKHASDGAFICSIGSYDNEPGSGEYTFPYGIAVATDGDVYVLDTWRPGSSDNHRVQMFSPNAQGTAYVSSGQIATPQIGDGKSHFLAVDAAGNIYVSNKADGGQNRVLKYDPSGTLTATIGSTGTGNGQLSAPNGVAVSPDGRDVYVSDGGLQVVKRFHSTDGSTYTQAQVFADTSSPMGYPCGVAIDAAGSVFVADNGLHRMIKFAADGSRLTRWGEQGNGEYQFLYPWGVAVGDSGCVCVSDPGSGGGLTSPLGNHRVMRFGRDLTAPVSQLTGLPTGWTNAASVSLTFSGTDPLVTDQFTSGYKATELLRSGGWAAQTGPYQVTDEGVTTVQYRSLDNAGNVETPTLTVAVRIDRTKPTTTVAGIPAGWSKAPVIATFDPTDVPSGVARCEYSTNGGATWTTGTSATIDSNGTTTLVYRSLDRAGNLEATRTATVKVDRVRPTPKPLAAVRVKRGKVAKLRYRVADSACPQAHVAIKIRRNGKVRRTIQLGLKRTGRDLVHSFRCALPRGTYTWTVFATDLAGNSQARTYSRKLTVR